MAPTQASGTLDNGHVGPHPSFIQVAKPYLFEQKIQECVAATGAAEAKEVTNRMQGIAWIDSARRALHLPVRTYNTAAVYFHKFRLHEDSEFFNLIDSAGAALLTACKIEDTLKKSKEILCAAHNLKLAPAEQLSPDDPIFEAPSARIIGLERMMLEASGFDFRNRYPQKLLLKLARYYHVDRDTVGKTAFNISLDLYRTFAPVKQTTPTMALACVELSGRLLEQNIQEIEASKGYKKWRTSRPEVMETLLDLLDLYTHHRAFTVVGQEHAIQTFIDIRITLNQEALANKYLRHTNSSTKKKSVANGNKAINGTKDVKPATKSPTSPRDSTAPKGSRSPPSSVQVTATGAKIKSGLKDGTVRFMLDPERARDEKGTVAMYFKIEEEEYEVEVERERRRG
ncbi:RNA polymerase II C-terminal domain kinase beta subunit [Schaereria dolodes]|nr:RNA polymerase II C-terminal domain kinase beta subunit [Schaereria dolodes]